MSSDELARLRALYHYYNKRDDLLSKCKSEVILAERRRIKEDNLAARNIKKVRRFLAEHPEYGDRFEKEGEI